MRVRKWTNEICNKCGDKAKVGYTTPDGLNLGYCKRHYEKLRRMYKPGLKEKLAVQRKEWYRSNLEHNREVNRKRSRIYFNKRNKEDPAWNKTRQKEFRRKHPEAFIYLMCRYYFKKLSKEQRKKLLEEE
jgi:hypothetical protein